MTTFLEYVAERLLGPPARRTGTDGESYWVCPFHGGDSFHTMPHKAEFKDRYQCFGCGARGDEADLMAGMIRGENYQRRRQRLDQWRQEYEREVEAAQIEQPVNMPLVEDPAGISFRGAGRLVEQRQDHPLEVAAAWADLTEGEREILVDAYRLMRARWAEWGRFRSVSLDALAKYACDFVESERRMEQFHRLTCDDPECDAPVCRRAWGEANMRHLMECRDPKCEVAMCRAAARRRMSRIPSVREEEQPCR